MSRCSDPGVAHRNTLIVKDFLSNRHQSYETLASRYKVGKGTLHLVLRAATATDKRAKKPRGPQKGAPIDNTLVALGHALEQVARERADTDWIGTATARAIGLRSGQYLTQIFRGQANLTYLDVQAIARWLGYSSAAGLLSAMDERLNQNVGTPS